MGYCDTLLRKENGDQNYLNGGILDVLKPYVK